MTDAALLDAPAAPVEAPVPRKRDAERTRKAILAAALKEFSQAGFAGARIEKIVAGPDGKATGTVPFDAG